MVVALPLREPHWLQLSLLQKWFHLEKQWSAAVRRRDLLV